MVQFKWKTSQLCGTDKLRHSGLFTRSKLNETSAFLERPRAASVIRDSVSSCYPAVFFPSLLSPNTNKLLYTTEDLGASVACYGRREGR